MYINILVYINCTEDKNMLNFVLCDDNQSVLDKLCSMLDTLFFKHQIEAEIAFSSTNPDKLLEYMNTHTTDVFILDIDLKSKLSGLDLAQIIRKTNKCSYLIFTSAHLEYILIAYKYKTFDFIPKPIAIERLEDTILRLIDDITHTTRKNSFIRLSNKNTIINQDSVNFIKKDGMKLIFYTNSRTYEVYSSFSKVAPTLPNNFVRCHKSYIVNINNIYDIQLQNNLIRFKENDQQTCFLGPKYKNNFWEVLNYYGFFTNNLDKYHHGEC